MSTATLHRVILNWPTVLNLTDAARSWVQVAKTGSFVSKRYGKFSITRKDLAQMLHNWRQVTPKAPTELPIDFDHLSMSPQRPGDGAAAGWMKKLELRDGGDTLWAEVEWTDDGADRVRKKEYRFISPSFVKNHTHKDGTQIGTTLLAAAITNHPFLEGMNALTLATPAIQAMNLDAPLQDLVAIEDGILCLSARPGQRVTVSAQHARAPQHVGVVFEIIRVDGMAGDDARVWLKNPNTGEVIGWWYRPDELEPARAANANSIPPDRRQQEDTTMHANNADDELIQLANTIAQERPGISLREATIEAGRRRKDLADARRQDIGVEKTDDADTQARPTVITLHRAPDEGFVELVGRVQRERRIDLRDAIRVVSQAFPALVKDYSEGTTL